MTDYLHITNGDSTRLGLDGSGVPGDVFSYGDILHEGPVPTGLPAGALGRLRAAWIADALDRDPAAVAAQAGREDAADGASEPDALFRAAAAQDQWIWMGDTVFWLWVRRLAAAPRPLVSIDVVAGTGGLPRGTVLLSPAGADVLAGRADGLSGRAIDRWMGGVHLTPERCWRWDGARLLAS